MPHLACKKALNTAYAGCCNATTPRSRGSKGGSHVRPSLPGPRRQEIPLVLAAERDLLAGYELRGAEARAAIAQWQTVEAGLAEAAKLVKQMKQLEGKPGGN